jgi:serine/threonine protein phosphatase PrpC
MKFAFDQISHQGGRPRNEDRLGVCHAGEAGMFVLADGMGGHPQGEVAAELAVQTMVANFQRAARHGIPDVRGFLASTLLEAHQAIRRYAADRNMQDAPRTTLVAALIESGCISWIHCGDSRLYLLRDGALQVRTRDHSYVEKAPAAGSMMPAGAPLNRHVLWTCLGSPAEPLFDVAGPLPLQQGDKVLLCSDGLWGSVTEPELVARLWQQPVAQAVPELAALALAQAGSRSDNVSVLALEWLAAADFQLTRDGTSLDGAANHGFAASRQTGGLDTMAHPLDDAAIERSIAEINEIIRRAAAHRK